MSARVCHDARLAPAHLARRVRRTSWAAVAVAVLSASAVAGAEWRGRVTTDLYGVKTGADKQWHPYISLQSNLLAWRDGKGRSLALHTYLRWTSDPARKSGTDARTYVYDAVVELKDVPRGSLLQFGRQLVYTGVGSALLDGIRGRYSPGRGIEIELFGGSSVLAQDPMRVRTLASSGTAGGRISVLPIPELRLGLGWIVRKSAGSVAYHRLGVDAERRFRHAALFGSAAYDAVGRRVGELLGRVTCQPGHWNLAGEYSWRAPSVAGNTLFSLIDYRPYRDARIDIQRTIRGTMAIVSQWHVDFFDGSEAWRTSLGIRNTNYLVAWQHQGGRAGDNDGLRGHVNRSLGTRWECFASAELFRYRVQLEQDGRSDAYSSGVGIQWRPAGGLTLRAEGQFLRNAVQKKDVRILLRASRDFSLVPQTEPKVP